MNSVLVLRLQFSPNSEENSVGFFLERAPALPVNVKLLFSGHGFTVITGNKCVQIHLGDEPPPDPFEPEDCCFAHNSCHAGGRGAERGGQKTHLKLDSGLIQPPSLSLCPWFIQILEG